MRTSVATTHSPIVEAFKNFRRGVDTRSPTRTLRGSTVFPWITCYGQMGNGGTRDRDPRTTAALGVDAGAGEANPTLREENGLL